MALRDVGRNGAILLARLALAALFLYTGWKNISDLEATALRVAGAGYPAPKVFALLAALAQLLGGVAVGLGAFFRLGCLALVAFLLPATYSFHLPGFRAGDFLQGVQTWKNLSIAGTALLLLVTGPGSVAVDRFLRRGA